MTNATIHKGMTVRAIIALVPSAADIMIEYGLHCFSCSVGGVETLEEGAGMHGFDADTIDALVEDINDAIGQAPRRPQTLTITAAAAAAIHTIAQSQERTDEILVVTLDEHGGFCLEFQDAPLEGDTAFFSPDMPAVKIYASPLALSRIGGATIDARDGRMKLDMPEECCRKGEECGCESLAILES